MSTPSRWSASFTVVLVLSLKHHSQGFLSDDETVVSLTPFDLTYTPAHVVRHVTRDVRLLCAHQTDDQTQLQEVSWIRMLMKTSSGWGLLAEHRDNEDEPQSTYNVSEAVRLLLGWGFNVVSIQRNRVYNTNKHWFHVKEKNANVWIAYCGKVITPCHEPSNTKNSNDGSWLASFRWNADDEREFSLIFSSVKGENLQGDLVRTDLETAVINFSKERVIVKADAKRHEMERTPWADSNVHQCLRLDCSTAEGVANPPQTRHTQNSSSPETEG
ncbi:hypothetical protein PoB_001162900 [Plakobranchus ocellatus]|uniref:Uncharacterized protein n=1 Tax=Plakobranchus ocellatus TaxID=259542 RepID=A0AAV3YQ21_9GAST|nr:hypothetical protein PoB_001162900 [Plakobranchus ocellatus]